MTSQKADEPPIPDIAAAPAIPGVVFFINVRRLMDFFSMVISYLSWNGILLSRDYFSGKFFGYCLMVYNKLNVNNYITLFTPLW
jgi:hypothetical protein